MAKEWDESKHPRTPKGHGDKSGEWRSSLEFTEEEFNADAVASMEKMDSEFFPRDKSYLDDPSTFHGVVKDTMERMLSDRLMKNPDWMEYVDARVKHTNDYYESVGSRLTYTREQASYDEIRIMIDNWAQTAGDSSRAAQLMQHIAAREFGLKGVFDHTSLARLAEDKKFLRDFDKLAKFSADASYVPVGVMLKGKSAFLREMYSATQEQLKAAGITEVYLARGTHHQNISSVPYVNSQVSKQDSHAKYKGPAVGYQKVRLSPMSSFSANANSAYAFAQMTQKTTGLVTYIKVPAARILSTPKSGFGCYGEQEVVVLGGSVRGLVTRPTNVIPAFGEQFATTQAAWAASQ